MTRGEDFIKKGRCKSKHCLTMLNSAWCDLNSKGDILKLHDKCPNPKCNCQKIITFTPHQYMLEGGSFKSKLQKFFRATKKAWDSFIEPGLKNRNTINISRCCCENEESLISSNNEYYIQIKNKR